jgi:serine protease AprX
MRKIIPLLITVIVFALPANAQLNRYLIILNDKADNSHTLSAPEQYLSQRALQRRARYNIAIDSADLPVTARYIDSIRLAGAVIILNTSKWLNQVAIFTTDAAALSKINAFQFVKSSIPVGSFTANQFMKPNKFETEPTIEIPANAAPPAAPTNLAQFYNYGLSNGQVKIHKGDFLHNHGFRGEGMQMTVLDAGFYHYLTLPTFDSIRINNQILGTWDFVDNEASVNEDHYHGMWCLSTIAANMPETFIGTAPKTSFYLYRTENVAGEYPIEEQNYAAGLERADSLGVDVASTSLGYFIFDDASLNYSYNDMDGNTSISARAADIAAKKGMLMVVAAGNEGNKPWHYLITPSDADSVLSVGAVDTLGNIANFSSYGPSSDGQIKPGVAAVGWNAMVANINTGTPVPLSGTSFACPNMAGLATCLWQAFPEENNMGIISALQQSASKATAPDDRVGYGIPDMKNAFVIILKRFYKQEIKQAGCNTFIKWNSKNSAAMSFEIQRKLPTDADFVSLYTQNGSGSFANGNFNYSDDLGSFITPLNISYRIKMNIDTDTSFYFDVVTINHINPCITYTFTGSGNWNVAANWEAGIIPPATLPAGSTILINPSADGECILNTNQEVSAGAYFNVMPAKKIYISGNLNIRE